MEFFLNEWSLQSQFRAIAQFEDAAVRLVALVARAQHTIQHGRGFLFRSQRIEERFAIAGKNFKQSLNAITQKEVREALLEVVFNRTSPAPWENDRLHDRPDEFHWLRPQAPAEPTRPAEVAAETALADTDAALADTDVDAFEVSGESITEVSKPESSIEASSGDEADQAEHSVDPAGDPPTDDPPGDDVTDTSMAELAERLLCEAVKVGCLLNFVDSALKGPAALDILKNRNALAASVPSFETVQAFDTWLAGKRGAAQYDVTTATATPLDEQTCLVDLARFVPTSRPPQHGRTIYEERTSGDLYYVDNAHKGTSAHLEVFTKRFVHRGDATLQGVLIPNTRDKRKDHTLE